MTLRSPVEKKNDIEVSRWSDNSNLVSVVFIIHMMSSAQVQDLYLMMRWQLVSEYLGP